MKRPVKFTPEEWHVVEVLLAARDNKQALSDEDAALLAWLVAR